MPGMKQLIFFTESFPYGKGESFIENEIEYLSREFDRIYIPVSYKHLTLTTN